MFRIDSSRRRRGRGKRRRWTLDVVNCRSRRRMRVYRVVWERSWGRGGGGEVFDDGFLRIELGSARSKVDATHLSRSTVLHHDEGV